MKVGLSISIVGGFIAGLALSQMLWKHNDLSRLSEPRSESSDSSTLLVSEASELSVFRSVKLQAERLRNLQPEPLSEPVSESLSTSFPLFMSHAIDLTALERSVYDQVNQHRLSVGLAPLQWDDHIQHQARQHSEAMMRGRVPISHTGFRQRFQAIAQVTPYQSAAENVGFNQGQSAPVRQALRGWLNSPDHRQALEGDFDVTGVGIAVSDRGEYFFTQIFIQTHLP